MGGSCLEQWGVQHGLYHTNQASGIPCLLRSTPGTFSDREKPFLCCGTPFFVYQIHGCDPMNITALSLLLGKRKRSESHVPRSVEHRYPLVVKPQAFVDRG